MKLDSEDEHDTRRKLSERLQERLASRLPHLESRAVSLLFERGLDEVVECDSVPEVLALGVGEAAATTNDEAMNTGEDGQAALLEGHVADNLAGKSRVVAAVTAVMRLAQNQEALAADAVSRVATTNPRVKSSHGRELELRPLVH